MYTPEITLPFEYPAHNRQWIDIEGHKHKVKPIKVKKIPLYKDPLASTYDAILATRFFGERLSKFHTLYTSCPIPQFSPGVDINAYNSFINLYKIAVIWRHLHWAAPHDGRLIKPEEKDKIAEAMFADLDTVRTSEEAIANAQTNPSLNKTDLIALIQTIIQNNIERILKYADKKVYEFPSQPKYYAHLVRMLQIIFYDLQTDKRFLNEFDTQLSELGKRVKTMEDSDLLLQARKLISDTLYQLFNLMPVAEAEARAEAGAGAGAGGGTATAPTSTPTPTRPCSGAHLEGSAPSGSGSGSGPELELAPLSKASARPQDGTSSVGGAAAAAPAPTGPFLGAHLEGPAAPGPGLELT